MLFIGGVQNTSRLTSAESLGAELGVEALSRNLASRMNDNPHFFQKARVVPPANTERTCSFYYSEICPIYP